MPETSNKVNFDLAKLAESVENSEKEVGVNRQQVVIRTTNEDLLTNSRAALLSRDTGLGESIYPSTAQSRLSLSIDGGESRGKSPRRQSAYSVSSRDLSDISKRQANAFSKFSDGMKKMRFFVRAYQAIKSSNQNKKQGRLDLGELAALLQGAQVDQPDQQQDEDEEEGQDEMKVFKTFNPRQYKHNAEYMWPYMAFEPIWRKAEERGIRDIRIIRGLMRGLHTYRKLPRIVQERVARVVRLERCTRGRTVIRKGQVPENFFFIFAGKVNVSCFEDEESVYEATQVVAQLNKGDWFGGVSMSRETGRELTVVAMEDCEFLVVDVLDFPDTGLKPIILSQLDQRFNCLRTHPFLKGVDDETIEKLVIETKTLDTPHDTVIVRDSKQCNHIYLICQGSCDVFRWMSSKLLDEPIEFETMKKHVRNDFLPQNKTQRPLNNITQNAVNNKSSSEQKTETKPTSQNIITQPKTASTNRRRAMTSREPTMTNSSDSILQRELAEIKEGVGKLPIEYLTFPLVNVTKQEQFEYWQKSRAERDSQTREKSTSYQSDHGMFVKLESLYGGSSFGLPEDLRKMTPMQLISSKSIVIEVPLSSFNRYLRHKVAPLIHSSFLVFNDLCHFSTLKFNRLNTWESLKRSLTDDVRAQRFTPEMDPYDIYYLQGGAAPTLHAPYCKYSQELARRSRQIHFVKPRQSLSNLQKLKLPNIRNVNAGSSSRPMTTHTLRSVRTSSTRPVSRVMASRLPGGALTQRRL